jgi:hypothetical protein
MPLVAIALLTLAGCLSSGSGTLDVQATDAPDNLDDFRHLNVTVTSIVIRMKDGGDKSYTPSSSTFDLTTLNGGTTKSLFKDDVPAGNYTRLELKVQDAMGDLKAGGSVAVKAPSGTLFLNRGFTVEEGKTTTFVFDIQVHKLGNGGYNFQPNASGSKVHDP